MESSQVSNYLTIRLDGKAVPYGGMAEPRPDGSQNFGFMNVKGNSTAAAAIPELAGDAALKSLVLAISDARCGLFSVGCLSGDVTESDGHRVTGYLEFAVNSKAKVTDASNYFPLFFKFHILLRDNQFNEPVVLHWELRPAAFHELDVNGFTCAITINTHFLPSAESALRCWNETLGVLEVYLGDFPVMTADPMY
jgi:hypothetical protein